MFTQEYNFEDELRVAKEDAREICREEGTIYG